MMHDYVYVPRSEYLPVKKELEQLINNVQDEVREYFTFSFTYVGSTHRKMITRDLKSNIGYDFDVNIHVNDDDEEFEAWEIRKIIRNAIDKVAGRYDYDFCEDSTRVLTIKKKDYFRSRLISSCDFAIVFDCDDGRQQYIHFNKNQGTYEWQFLPVSNYELEDKADVLKKSGHWEEVRTLYIEKKNYNENKSKRSRSLYAESISEMYQRYGNE